MTPNNNLSVLPWYTSVNLQNHRKDYAFGNVYPLVTPYKMMLPFQIIREHRSNGISKVLLKTIDGKTLADITTTAKETGLTIKQFTSDGYDIIIYPGTLPMSYDTPEGQCYAELSDGVQTWYSEVFTIKRIINNDYLLLQWWDDENLYYSGGHIDYSDGFKNKLYLPTQVGKPEYSFNEEGENRDGYFFPEKQVSEKTYKFTFLAPEYLCDAMRIIRMSDHVLITSKGQTYEADSFLITPEWQDQGDLAAVEAEFETNTVIKKIGSISKLSKGGDFNFDYNIDYNNGLNLIDNIITIKFIDGTITSQYPVASDRKIKVRYLDIDGEEYTDMEYTLQKGKSNMEIDTAQESIQSAIFTNSDYDDTYKYIIKIIN